MNETYKKLVDLYAGRELTDELDSELETAAMADPQLKAEMATLRHEALRTEEVAGTVAFLLSPRSSGINGQGLVIDAGMSSNYFDPAILHAATRPSAGPEGPKVDRR